MSAHTEDAVFVPAGRQEHIYQLGIELQEALAGAPRVVFVTGEAGIGKTSLLREFCRQMQEQHRDLIVAWGQCSAILGLGDPYRPFKDIMGLLTGDVTSMRAAQLVVGRVNAERLKDFLLLSGEVLLDVGGDLLDIFVPGSALLARAISILGSALNIGWIEKLKARSKRADAKENLRSEHLFEQFSRVLMRLAEKRPLLLVIDDLHWADAGTLALLFYLSRRFKECERLPLLIVGAYRPIELEQRTESEVAPLFRKIISEVRRYGRDVIIDLSSSITPEHGYAFVDAYLDTEPNRLDGAVRMLLAQRTGGHPLFTVEILRMLQEQGVLVKDSSGYWVVNRRIEVEDLPDRVEAVVAERIQQLEDELREHLECASVEGEEFTAQVVAHVQHVPERELIKELGGKLDRDAQLIEPSATMEVLRRRLHRFRFRHALFQVYLYQSLNRFEKEMLHGDVGEALEALYASESRQIAGQLAQHFELAHMPDKAARYYKLAGDHARSEFANANAVELYGRALALLPDSADGEMKFEILCAREQAYDSMGQRDEQLADLERLLSIAKEEQKPAWLARVYNSFAKYYERTAEYEPAVTSARTALDTARQSGEDLLECESWIRLAWIYFWLSTREAIDYSQCAVDTARRIGSRWFEARALDILGLNYRETNEYPAAQQHLLEALSIARETGDRWCELDSLDNLGIVYRDMGNYAAAIDYGTQALHIARTIGDRWGESDTLYDLSQSLWETGYLGEALHHMEEALRTAQIIDYHWVEANVQDLLGEFHTSLGNYATARHYFQEAASELPPLQDPWVITRHEARLGRLYYEQGDLDAALAHLDQALTRLGQFGVNRIFEPATLDRMGRVFEQTGELDKAEQCYLQALTLAVDMERHFVAATARASQARTALTRGNLERAQQLVEENLAWIAEHGVESLNDPAWVCLCCAHVLQAAGDLERASSILKEGSLLLLERAKSIDDPALRTSYLENVTANREVFKALQQMRQAQRTDKEM